MEVWQFNEQSMHPAWDTIPGPTTLGTTAYLGFGRR